MKIATRTQTGQQVEVVAINGGWTTIRALGSAKQIKVRNGELSGHTEVTAPIVRKYIKEATVTAEAVIAKASARAKMDINERKNGKVDPLYLPQYTAYTTELADGTKKRSIDKGDGVAVALRKLTLDGVYAQASKATGISQAGLRDRFAHLNPGMQRMNLGNMIRKALKETANA
jgi:hypothetical protein